MEPALTAALIGAIVSALTVSIGYVQWRRDVKIKLNQIREEVSIELIRQRIEPYAEFMLECEKYPYLHKPAKTDSIVYPPFRKFDPHIG